MSRPLAIIVAVSAAAIAAVWLVPPVGFVAVLVLLVILPPWGTSLAERAVISGVVVCGVVAILVPRAGSMPVTQVSARLLLTGLVVALLALRAVPSLREIRIPRPTLADGVVLLLGGLSALWLMAAYIGQSSYAILSGLFFSGWDNQAHFTTMANTYEVGSTTWPTVDGSIAWNQWYPSLHTTIWSIAELASRSTQALLDRPGLLWPYVQWSALSFAFCLVALAWVAGDVAARFGGRDRERWTRPLAAGAFALFGLLGSPALLFNKGFTNFMMGVAVVVVAAYVSARTLRSARMLGWFLVPLGAIAAIGLWTPLALGLVPSGIVVAIALIKHRPWIGITWIAASIAAAAWLALTQTAAILGVEPGQSTGDFTADLGSVGSGMSAFNIGAALLAPLVAVLFAVLLIRRHQWPTAVAILGPITGAAIVALVFAGGADSSDLGRLQSYYVLKPLNAMLLAVAPLIAALAAVTLDRALRGVSRVTAGLAIALGGVVVVALFGYVGATSKGLGDGFAAAPGVQAGADRTRGVNDPVVGEALIRARDAAVPYPDYTTMLWDAGGTLPNLWVSSLHGVMSKAENRFYRDLPPFPYDAATAEYVSLSLNLNPAMRVALLWFRPPSGELLETYVSNRSDDRVTVVQVPMPSNVYCPECSL